MDFYSRGEKMEIREFQKLIKKLYFHKDSERGVEKTFIWLCEELGELAEALLKKDKAMLKEELADVFAWLVSLANLLEIDLEDAVREKYPEFCVKCGKAPCECKEKTK